MVALAWHAWPGWSSAAHGLGGLLQVLTLLVSALGSVALAGFRAAFGVLALARGWAESMADWAARLAPGVRVGIGLSYVAMFLAVLRVLERDLRGDARERTEEWRS